MAWPNPPFLSADAPIEDAADDRLDRARLATQLGHRLIGYHGDRALAVGVCGDWGSGKTSFVNLVADVVKKDGGLRANGTVLAPVRFTPWAFGSRDDIALDLLSELGRAVGTASGGTALGRAISADLAALVLALGATYATQPDHKWAFLVGALQSIPVVKGLVKSTALGRQKVEPTLQERYTAISAKLRDANALLVVTLDDLERLPVDQIQGVFRVVGALASFSNTVYVLTMDRHRVAEALNESYGDGHAYLEKFLHLTFDLPPPDPQVLGTLFVDKVNDLHRARRVEVDTAYFGEVWRAGLKDLIETPRDIGRVLNGYDMALDAVPADTNLVDLLALEALRVTEPAAHRALAVSALAVLREHQDLIDRIQARGKEKEQGEVAFKAVIDAVSERRRTGVANLLRAVFPATARGTPLNKAELHRNHRAASPEHFDHFFRWNLATGEITEADLLTALEVLITAHGDDAVREWVEAHRHHFQAFSEKLFNYLTNLGDSARRQAFAASALRVAHGLDDNAFFVRSELEQALSLAFHALKEAPAGWDSGVWERAKGTSRLYGVARFFASQLKAEARGHGLPEPTGPVLDELAEAIGECFAGGEHEDFTRIGGFLYRWRDVARSDAAPRAFVARAVAERRPVVWAILRDLLNIGSLGGGGINRENLRIFDGSDLAKFLEQGPAPVGSEALIRSAQEALE